MGYISHATFDYRWFRYTSTPTVTITGKGTGATATCTIANGEVTSLQSTVVEAVMIKVLASQLQVWWHRSTSIALY